MDAKEQVLEWIEIRKETIKEMRKAADTLEKLHSHQSNTSVDSGLANFTSSLMGLGSVVLAPFSGGASLLLLGTSVGTSCINFFGNSVDKEQEEKITVQKEIKILVEKEKKAKQKVMDIFQVLESNLKDLKISLSREEARSLPDVLKCADVDLQLEDVGNFEAANFLLRCVTNVATACMAMAKVPIVRNLVTIQITIIQESVLRIVQFGNGREIIQYASSTLCKLEQTSRSVTRTLVTMIASGAEIATGPGTSASMGAVYGGSTYSSVTQSTKISARSQKALQTPASKAVLSKLLYKANLVAGVAIVSYDFCTLWSALTESKQPMKDVSALRKKAREMEENLLKVEQEFSEKYAFYRDRYNIFSNIHERTKDENIYGCLKQTHAHLQKNL